VETFQRKNIPKGSSFVDLIPKCLKNFFWEVFLVSMPFFKTSLPFLIHIDATISPVKKRYFLPFGTKIPPDKVVHSVFLKTTKFLIPKGGSKSYLTLNKPKRP
jgi:hypothetical protein